MATPSLTRIDRYWSFQTRVISFPRVIRKGNLRGLDFASFFMAGHLQGLSRASAIERRAQSLSDPIARLRYLRHATANTAGRPPRRGWIACCALVLLLLTWRSDAFIRHSAVPTRRAALPVRPAPDVPNIWPVEQTSEYDLYSNGL